ncbi:hypothetical protein H0H81_010544 [Sphagnurus paluster]|uniref:Uncharacterized protein n=1 Tax=Sphagnurus paluster TaxID=117069 RepID=A0A9P7FX57_9AGAR|nr:hypothetical protein H0H81_010544 [Sphagnurus paluster]
MHNASTAQEIEVIAPNASGFQMKRWHDPSPISPPSMNTRLPSPVSPSSSWRSRSSPGSISGSESEEYSPLPELKRQDTITFDHLPNQSLRTLFILDRFTTKGTILYCSNDNLITTTTAMGRSFYDFVHEKNEATVRSWIDAVKGWGVNELGQPSDGGFGYGCFTLLTKGRDSSERLLEPSDPPSASRRDRGNRSRALRAHLHYVGGGRVSHIPDRGHAGGNGRSTLPPPEGFSPQVAVDAIFSAHSDGLMVVLRRSET